MNTMDLECIDLPVCWETPPAEITRIIENAENLYNDWASHSGFEKVPMLVNSNFYVAYHALNQILTRGLAGDRTFCEWGSGLGVVTCIAAQLGYDACGIEIESSLCSFAAELSASLGLRTEFIQGSYREVPDTPGKYGFAPFPLGRRPISLFYAYPWPAEEAYLESLFKRYRNPESKLVTYHGRDQLFLKRYSGT